MPVIDGRRPRATACVLIVCAVVLLGRAASGQGLARMDRSLTMEEAVDVALQRSLRVRAAGADARIMESMRREAFAPFWPQISANGYFADQRMGPNVYTSAGNTMARNYQVFDADQTRDANVTAMYPLFSGGRDYYALRAASRRAEAGREMLRGTEVDVAMQARLDYVNAVREAENVRVTETFLSDVDERLRIARQMFDAGRIPRYYLLRDETERANAVQMLAMARSRAEQAVIALKTTLGVDLASDITLTDRLDVAPTPVSVPDAIREAGERQPEIRALVKQREAAEADVRAAYGNYWPQLSVSYMYDWAWMKTRAGDAAMESARARTDSAEGYSVGLVVTLPVFDGFMRENAVKTARARLDRAREAEDLARQQIAKEINQAALMLAAAERSVEASRTGLEQAEEEMRAVRERFESGRGIQLEVLDAQLALTRARFNAVNALSDYHSARAMWLRAAGRAR